MSNTQQVQTIDLPPKNERIVPQNSSGTILSGFAFGTILSGFRQKNDRASLSEHARFAFRRVFPPKKEKRFFFFAVSVLLRLQRVYIGGHNCVLYG